MWESHAAVILFQILSAINYCHQRKIIHRDLKPENIILDNTSKNDYPYIKINDFDTKFIDEEYENQLIGSPYYMVPVVFEKNILINAIFGQLELFYILLFLKESLLKIFLIVQKKMKLI